MVDGINGCGYCGGLGHRVLDCPKLLQVNKSKNSAAYQYDSMDDLSSI
jgi:ATP-dependent RNA helicase DDX41